jgi:hypothetical protein
MHLPRVQFTVRRIMAAVAVAALVSLVASNPYRHDGITDKRVVIPVASIVAAVYGLGAMRRPLMFLFPLIVALIAPPQVDHYRPDVINISAASCFLGWIIGAPAGWLSRSLARPANSLPVTTEPIDPK